MLCVEEETLKAFRELIAERNEQHLYVDKFVVIKQEEISDIVDSLSEGIVIGKKKYGFNNYIVKRIIPKQ